MPGPPPKPAALRQRRNKSTTAANLPSEATAAENEVPALHARPGGAPWHPMVIEWWEAVWRSPMATEFVDSDKRELYEVAELRQDFWTAERASARISASKEIRLQEARFGLSPIDRRRLQWEVARGEEAERKTRKPKAPEKPKSGDPRDVLRLA